MPSISLAGILLAGMRFASGIAVHGCIRERGFSFICPVCQTPPSPHREYVGQLVSNVKTETLCRVVRHYTASRVTGSRAVTALFNEAGWRKQPSGTRPMY